MKPIKILVSNTDAIATEVFPIVVGTVGLQVEFMYDSFWDDLQKTAVFRANGKTYDVLNIDDCAVIPWELLQRAGDRLLVGVYGTNTDGSLQIPTVWVDLGLIVPGADPSGDESADPTFPVWEQILREVNTRLDNVRTEISNGVKLTDRATGKDYIVYVSGGKLIMEESEV